MVRSQLAGNSTKSCNAPLPIRCAIQDHQVLCCAWIIAFATGSTMATRRESIRSLRTPPDLGRKATVSGGPSSDGAAAAILGEQPSLDTYCRRRPLWNVLENCSSGVDRPKMCVRKEGRMPEYGKMAGKIRQLWRTHPKLRLPIVIVGVCALVGCLWWYWPDLVK